MKHCRKCKREIKRDIYTYCKGCFIDFKKWLNRTTYIIKPSDFHN